MFQASLCLAVLLVSISSVGRAAQCSDEAPTATAAAADTVRIKAVGDLVFGNDYPQSHYPPNFVSEAQTRLRQAIGTGDVIFGNFEGALTTYTVSPKKPNYTTVFAFRMPPAFATMMRETGFNVLHIANNHTSDYGERGYVDTLAHISKAGITVVGEPDTIAWQTINNTRIAWIGFSHLYRHNYVGDLPKLATLIQHARAKADLVIVSMQAGAEGSDALKVRNADEMFLGENRGNTYAFAHRAVDLGADLVIGHGPHVVRGMECYKGKLIAYSLGNFVGYEALSTKRAAAISMVLDVTLSKDRRTIGFDVMPMKFDEQKFPEPDPSALARYLINDLSRLAPLNGSVNLPVSSDGMADYRHWLNAAELNKILNEPPPAARKAKP